MQFSSSVLKTACDILQFSIDISLYLYHTYRGNLAKLDTKVSVDPKACREVQVTGVTQVTQGQKANGLVEMFRYILSLSFTLTLTIITAAVAQWVRMLTPQAEDLVFEYEPRQT